MNKHHKPKKGQGLVEYALIMVLVSTVSLAVLVTLGKSVQNTFYNTSSELIKITGDYMPENPNQEKNNSNSGAVTANDSLACLKTSSCP